MIYRPFQWLFDADDGGGVLGGDGGGSGGGSGDGGKGAGSGDPGNAGAGNAGNGGTGDGGAGNASVWTPPLNERGEFKEGWIDTLPDTLKPAKDTLARYKSPEAALYALHNANVKLGEKSAAVLIPNDKSTPEQWAEFRKAFNVPEKPEGYDLKVPDDFPKEIPVNKELQDKYTALMHKHNISADAAKDLFSLRLEEQKAFLAADQQVNRAYVESQKAELRKEWGDQTNANRAKCLSVLKVAGLTPDDPALAHASTARALLNLYNKFMAEDVRRGDGHFDGEDVPGKLADAIQTDTKHPLYDAYQSQHHPKHEEAVRAVRADREAEAAARQS